MSAISGRRLPLQRLVALGSVLSKLALQIGSRLRDFCHVVGHEARSRTKPGYPFDLIML
jgi:hypothetical protein